MSVDLDPVRAALHQMWQGAAPSWEQHADYVDERCAPITLAMLDAAEVAAGDRVLELACGPGGVGLAAAERIGEKGNVVLSDVAPEMVRIAEARAAALGLANVEARERDLESIDEDDATFDVVLCREGLMLVPDPARAAREMRRVLRPGGRMAVAVWGPRDRNPWLGILFDSITEHLGVPVPPPGVPGPFALADAARVATLLTEAGCAAVRVREVAVPVRVPDFATWWSTVPALAGPVSRLLESLPGEVRAAIRASAEQALAPYVTPHGLDIPGVSLVASGSA